ncbi:HNH endonuclease [Xanthomonas cucurbitae]|uniref:HNH endonuclease n=1 Tax=Xanthomonas cucurbitae TaxID=56453 RepID=A0ABY7YBY9_9XANT|nr:hypothetical protein [Xanthomonas cucurbitae]WDM67473.1 HNH endonuclease [Xanthomonas cucurbitae]WDM71349.1 HNH endonuclease [Xanthomonas cucurbitae]
MTEIFEHPPKRPIHLCNINCVYCGKDFSPELTPTKEHVIARRFVPRGTLDGRWNLILQACGPCNHEKSQLEDDISVITMLPDATGCYAVEDERLREEVLRRAQKSGSRRTGKSVAASQEHVSISASPFPTVKMTFGLVAPPQADPIRLHRLAEFHFTAFFFLSSYSRKLKRGGFSSGPFFRIAALNKNNWGNPKSLWFMEVTRHWELRTHGITAEGFFKIVIRKCPTMQLWSYAVQWNHSMRVLEFSGEPNLMSKLLVEHPFPTEAHGNTWPHDEGGFSNFTAEVPFDYEHDALFSW